MGALALFSAAFLDIGNRRIQSQGIGPAFLSWQANLILGICSMLKRTENLRMHEEGTLEHVPRVTGIRSIM